MDYFTLLSEFALCRPLFDLVSIGYSFSHLSRRVPRTQLTGGLVFPGMNSLLAGSTMTRYWPIAKVTLRQYVTSRRVQSLYSSNSPSATTKRFYSSDVRSLIYKDLRAWRKSTADEMQKPIYQVLNNKVMEEISTQQPTKLEELSMLSGIGPTKLQQYGRMILDIVQQHTRGIDPSDPAVAKENEKQDLSFWELYDKPIAKKKRNTSKKKEGCDADEKTKPRRRRVELMSEYAISQLELPEYISFSDLNSEQQEAAQHILGGNNVFMTGSAGTGKTYLLKYIVQELVKVHGEEAVAVTAPTGVSAINVGGQTIHSFSGIGIGEL